MKNVTSSKGADFAGWSEKEYSLIGISAFFLVVVSIYSLCKEYEMLRYPIVVAFLMRTSRVSNSPAFVYD